MGENRADDVGGADGFGGLEGDADTADARDADERFADGHVAVDGGLDGLLWPDDFGSGAVGEEEGEIAAGGDFDGAAGSAFEGELGDDFAFFGDGDALEVVVHPAGDGALVGDPLFGFENDGEDDGVFLADSPDEAASGGVGPAGFEADAAIVLAHEAVGVFEEGVFGVDAAGDDVGLLAADADELGVFEGGAGDAGEVASGGEVVGVGQAVGVGEPGVGGTELGGALVHQAGEVGNGAADFLGDGDAGIVGAAEEHGVGEIADGELFSGLEAEGAAADAADVAGGGEDVFGLEALEGEERGHDFGRAGGVALLVGADGVEDLAGGGVHDEDGLGGVGRRRQALSRPEGRCGEHPCSQSVLHELSSV